MAQTNHLDPNYFVPQSGSLDFNPTHPGVIELCWDLANALVLKPAMTLSEWAEANIILSSEYAASSQPLRLQAYQRGLFDSFTDPTVEEITVMSSTQLTKTLFLQAVIAYIICVDGAHGPILLAQPKEEDAKSFSKERLGPMRRDIAALRERITDSDRSGNTLLMKEFPGGSLSLIGSIAAGNWSRRSIRYLLADEIDKYPVTVGSGANKEGDPISLGRERTMTFRSRKKIIKTCSPTEAGRSLIYKEYMASDQRKPWVPCWKCGLHQVLKFANIKFQPKGTDLERAQSSYYLCANTSCQAVWNEDQRKTSLTDVQWRADAPFVGHAGFWVSHLYTPFKTMADIVHGFLKAKHSGEPGKLQVFVNTNLAETWTVQGDTPQAEKLYAQREDYWMDNSEDCVVPVRGLFLTAQVDVQDNPPRLEVEVTAHGRSRETWSVDYRVIEKQAPNGQALPVTSAEIWEELNNVLNHEYRHELGELMPIRVMCIDTGNRPAPVYEFALKHSRIGHGPSGITIHSLRTVVPIKGNDDDVKVISSVSKEDASRKRQGVRIVHVGTHRIKQELFDQLRDNHPRADGRRVPGCHHFPMAYSLEYFNGLTSEARVVNQETREVTYVKKANARNEPLDLKVYARAAAAIVGIDRFTEDHWRAYEKQLGVDSDAEEQSERVEAKASVDSMVLPDTPVANSGGVHAADTEPVAAPVERQPVRTVAGRRVRASFGGY